MNDTKMLLKYKMVEIEKEIEQIEQDRTGGKVILESSPPLIKQKPQYQYWCFTFNNYLEEQIEQLEQLFEHECKWYIFQEEIGENGTPHLQGTLCLTRRQRLTELVKINPKIHWEPTKSVQASKVYCSKKESASGRVFAKGIEIPEKLELEEPYGWQLQVLDIIKSKPDKRTVHWFWERDGGVGKTSLCKYLEHKHKAMMVTGKSSDMFHLISKYPNRRKIILVNVPRSTQDFINYGAIEAIKDGFICSGKYEGCILNFNSPHVIVFANEPPDYDKMSEDRWNVVRIQK